MESKFFFTAGVVGMLSGVASGATDGADVDYGWDWRPYIMLRGGWLFSGDVKGDFTAGAHPEDNRSLKENIKNAWSGSEEFGVSCFDERVFVGLEFGCFTGKFKLNEPFECIRATHKAAPHKKTVALFRYAEAYSASVSETSCFNVKSRIKTYTPVRLRDRGETASLFWRNRTLSRLRC